MSGWSETPTLFNSPPTVLVSCRARMAAGARVTVWAVSNGVAPQSHRGRSGSPSPLNQNLQDSASGFSHIPRDSACGQDRESQIKPPWKGSKSPGGVVKCKFWFSGSGGRGAGRTPNRHSQPTPRRRLPGVQSPPRAAGAQPEPRYRAAAQTEVTERGPPGSAWTHRDLRAPGTLPMEAEHDDLQAVAAVGAFEEAGSDEVIRVAGREVDAAVGQAVAVGGTMA